MRKFVYVCECGGEVEGEGEDEGVGVGVGVGEGEGEGGGEGESACGVCVPACMCGFVHQYNELIFTGGNRTKLPSSRWRRRGRSLREVFACSCFFATTDLSQIYNRET